MPYSIETEDGITIDEIPDDIAPDSQILKDRVAKLREGRVTTPSVEGEDISSPGASTVEPPPGMLSRAASAVGEMFTGNERATPETQSLPDWMQMPSLGLSGGWNAFKTVAGSTFAAPDEIAQMVHSNIPGAGIRQDAKGNYIFKDPQDGQEYAMAPGFTASDLGRAAVGAPLMAMPFGKNILQAARIGAGTQAAIEGSQAMTGGSFDPEQIVLAGAGSGLLKGASNVVSNVVGDVVNLARRAIGPANVVGDSASQGINMVDSPALLDGEALAKLARKAGDGSSRAKSQLAEQYRPDAQSVEDVATLNIKSGISPEFLAESENAKRLSAAAIELPGSFNKNNKTNSMATLADAAEKTLREVGSLRNLGAVDDGVKTAVTKNINDLKAVEKVQYNELKVDVPENTPIQASATLGYLSERLAKNKGDMNALSKLERDVYTRLNPEAIKSADGLTTKPFKSLGVFEATTDLVSASRTDPVYAGTKEGIVKYLGSLLKQDKMAAFRKLGYGEKLESAHAMTELRKGFENESKILFGKKLDKSMFDQVKNATNKLAAGRHNDYVKIMKTIPEPLRKQAAVEGLRLTFGRGAADGSLDVGKFHTFWDDIRANPQSFTALAANLPEGVIKKMDAVARLSKNIAAPIRGESTEVMKQRLIGANTLSEKLFQAAERFSSRAGAEIATKALNISTFGSAWVLQKLLTKNPGAAFEAVDKTLASPAFLATVRKIGTPDEKQAIKQFIMSKQFKALRAALKNPSEFDRMEEALINAVQAASRPEREKL